MIDKDFNNIYTMFESLRSEKDRYKPLWDDIADYVGIRLNTYYEYDKSSDIGQAKDDYIEDPTAQASVNQFGDYLIGILWGTGDNAFNITPSRYVLEIANNSDVEDYYNFITDQALYHMNHSEAGLNNALKAYAYDQAAFGTAGIGAFPNKDFTKRIADNALFFRQYGVDNIVIDEGKNGCVDFVFCTYRWRVNRIISEFASDGGGEADGSLIKKLPKKIRDAWAKGNYNEEFNLVFGVLPRADFDPKLQGKRGTRYRGVWFLDGEKNDNNIFAEEDFQDKPIAIARMIKIRGEIYGRSSGSMLISTIKSVNFMVSTAIMVIEKMANPALGMFNNAIGGQVLDTSPNGLTIFNPDIGVGRDPTFKLYDVGDPRGLVEFLIPYLNDKISTAFKIDALLDFNSAKDMTATESLHRYAIRGKSLAGILIQQKTELLEPLIKRCINILFRLGEMGIDPEMDAEKARTLKSVGATQRIIPDAVKEIIKEGRPWFEIRFNNELEKLTRTEKIENLVQLLQSVGAVASLNPQIVSSIDWYKLIEEINANLDSNNGVLRSREEFEEEVAMMAQQQQAMMGLQAGQMQAQANRDNSQADKNMRM